ncbi:MAG: GNAT family N-acetyltransferase [Firmicutes bacterium]|nr:GNAT family N-acetyltransferase [Bacillota bacterium]
MSQIMGDRIALQLKKAGRCRLLYQILLKDEVIGEVELDQIAWRSGEAELKIAIFDTDKQRHGLGTDAVTTLVAHAFGSMNLKRVYLRVHASNAVAIRCYEKAGFKKEGKLQRCLGGSIREEILLMAVGRGQFQRKRPPEAV